MNIKKILSSTVVLVLSTAILTWGTALFAAPNVQMFNDLVYTSPPLFEPQYNEQWNNIIKGLDNPTTRSVKIYWKGEGGYTTPGKKFMVAVLGAQIRGVNVKFILTDSATSMHAIVLCVVNNIEIRKNGDLQFHSIYSRKGGRDGKGAKEYDDPQTRKLLGYCVDRGILTNQDVDRIVNERKLVIVDHGDKYYLEDYK